MRHKKAILLCAALAAMPAASPAATLTYLYTTGDAIRFGTTPTSITSPAGVIPGTSVSGTGAAEVVTVPVGDCVAFGMTATVTNNNDAGLYGFNLGFNDSNGASSQINTSSQTKGTPLGLPGFSSLFKTKYGGQYDGAGGVLGTTTGGLGGSYPAASGATYAQAVVFAYGATGALFSSEIITAKAAGTSVFTSIQVNSGTGLLSQTPLTTINQVTPGFSGPGTLPSSASYQVRAFNPATDTIGPLPSLTIVAEVPEPGTSAGIILGVAAVISRPRGRRSKV